MVDNNVGRPKKPSGKYLNPIGGVPVGVFEFREIMRFLKKRSINKFGYISGKNKRGRGRPTGSYTYKDPRTQKPISVYKWRNITHWRRKQYKVNRVDEIIKRLKKEAEKYNISLKILVNIKKRCFLCGFNKFLCDIHHIDKNKNNNNSSNLLGLCPTCHMGIHRGYILISSENQYFFNPQNLELINKVSESKD